MRASHAIANMREDDHAIRSDTLDISAPKRFQDYTIWPCFRAARFRSATARRHVAIVLDQAGWHGANALPIPTNITLLSLPAYAAELNSVERVWLYLKERFLSHRLLVDYDAIAAGAGNACNRLCVQVGRITSPCSYRWIPTVRH